MPPRLPGLGLGVLLPALEAVRGRIELLRQWREHNVAELQVCVCVGGGAARRGRGDAQEEGGGVKPVTTGTMLYACGRCRCRACVRSRGAGDHSKHT